MDNYYNRWIINTTNDNVNETNNDLHTETPIVTDTIDDANTPEADKTGTNIDDNVDKFFDTSMNETTNNHMILDNSNSSNDKEIFIDTDSFDINMDTDTPTMFCNGANDTKLFPTSRLGSLDKGILKKLGMKRKILETNNFLFFYQLTLLICGELWAGA